MIFYSCHLACENITEGIFKILETIPTSEDIAQFYPVFLSMLSLLLQFLKIKLPWFVFANFDWDKLKYIFSQNPGFRMVLY